MRYASEKRKFAAGQRVKGDAAHIRGGIYPAAAQDAVRRGRNSRTDKINVAGLCIGHAEGYGLCGHEQVIGKAVQYLHILANACRQVLHDRFLCIRAQLPDVRRRDRISARRGIRNIKDIFNTRLAVLLRQDTDAGCTAIDAALGTVAPKRQIRAGGSVRTLAEDHHLRGKIILVQPCCGIQKPQPLLRLLPKVIKRLFI
ncbi:hypothetical protein [Agathobaculum desmolans]|uniref:hypothetical protein n=1 Tax=Agathobaculum desmolans TaxID=39484 RepID=UPI00248DAF50|nr:hypothetical protein [Agathobaculum desmolans]